MSFSHAARIEHEDQHPLHHKQKGERLYCLEDLLLTTSPAYLIENGVPVYEMAHSKLANAERIKQMILAPAEELKKPHALQLAG